MGIRGVWGIHGDVIQTIVEQTGYYGEIYRYCYCAEQMALEKMTPRT